MSLRTFQHNVFLLKLSTLFLISNQILGTYGQNLLAYKRKARGANLHPGVKLHPGANLHPGAIVHMNTALDDQSFITETLKSTETH